MQGDMNAQQALPALLATQLLAAKVYSHFLRLSSANERGLWKTMLAAEMDHANHMHRLLGIVAADGLSFPSISIERLQEVCDFGHRNAEQFLMRLEGALRLECAELDYGLEGLVARRLEKSELLPSYAGDVREHISLLLEEAKRYSASPNIGLQASRLSDLFETCLANSEIPRRQGSERFTP